MLPTLWLVCQELLFGVRDKGSSGEEGDSVIEKLFGCEVETESVCRCGWTASRRSTELLFSLTYPPGECGLVPPSTHTQLCIQSQCVVCRTVRNRWKLYLSFYKYVLILFNPHLAYNVSLHNYHSFYYIYFFILYVQCTSRPRGPI